MMETEIQCRCCGHEFRFYGVTDYQICNERGDECQLLGKVQIYLICRIEVGPRHFQGQPKW